MSRKVLARYVHRDDHAKALGAITQAWASREPVQTTLRLMRSDGGWFDVDCRFEPVKSPDGTVETWAVEAGAPNAMFRRGFRKDSLPPGAEILIEGFRAKSGKNMANGRDITLADGRKPFSAGSWPPPAMPTCASARPGCSSRGGRFLTREST